MVFDRGGNQVDLLREVVQPIGRDLGNRPWSTAGS